MKPIPLPEFYDPQQAENWSYGPDAETLLAKAIDWRKTHAISSVSEDRTRIHLLLVDLQKDFCFPEGSLFVAGRSGDAAINDSRRLAEFIYRNLGSISNITATMDTHIAYQIFSPCFWLDSNGDPPPANTIVRSEDIQKKHLLPNPKMAAWLCDGNEEWLYNYSLDYCKQLERDGKYELYLWPPHCLAGSDGHGLVGVIQEARLFHAYCRSAQSRTEIKGSHPLTENYSVFSPEVQMTFDGVQLAQTNSALLNDLLASDAILIAGQASSHCVRFTIEDLLQEIRFRNPKLTDRVYILSDCMSPVTVPDGQGGFLVDFSDDTEKAMQHFKDAGMHLVQSTEPMASWLSF